jgi:hypothetical protein
MQAILIELITSTYISMDEHLAADILFQAKVFARQQQVSTILFKCTITMLFIQYQICSYKT